MNQRPPIAVVGMDGIFPGAPNLEAYWKTIVEGIDRSAPIPDHRWIAPSHDRLRSRQVPDTTYSRHACLIDDFTFDSEGFGLDPRLTRQLDPVHQLTLTAGKRAVSGCRTADVDLNRVHTILAAIALPTDSASAFSRKIMGRAIERRLFSKPSTAPPIALTRDDALASRVDGLPAALLAAEMGFGGDSFTLDAACASSIFAVKLACDALASMRADMVVTGGVSRPECLYTQTGFSQLQALSPSGRCAPFDRQADGLVVGEGVGILILKRLTDAIDHGDTIHGVIYGIGLSNDMRGNLLAPEGRGQVRAMRAAYRSAGWRPSDVDLIECHGTGTRVGDTTEIESLIQLWEDESAASSSCAIGSVKSMIGHLLTGAGAAGMIKILLAMQYGILPPSINFEQAPPDSPLPDSPFRVQVSAQPWHPRNDGSPRRAAVSAFGFGGINAHILFQEVPAASKKAPPGRSAPISVQGLRTSTEIPSSTPVAIVGMDVSVGSLGSLKSFEKAIFEGFSTVGPRPLERWKGVDATLIDALGGMDPLGGYIDRLQLNIGEFQIPPKEINDILPQQLLALKVGAGAMHDAGLPLRETRPRMGVVVGIGFDFEATNYHLRWQLYSA
ncbi:MAG: beta-ketoacyl synthase N-terminal-like domain-containing protein, partial [Desulfosarcina sp.]